MSIAQGPRVRMSYCAETVHGTTPGSPTMKELRSIQRNINLSKTTLKSQEINPNRQINFLRHGMNRVEGPVGFELSTQSYDDWLAYLLGGTWDAVTTSGSPNLSATASTNIFTRAAGSFVSDGFRAGDMIVTTGFSNSANNGNFLATAVTSTTITVAGTLVTESSGSGKTLNLIGKRLSPGTTLTTMTIERAFLDIDQYQVFRGCTPNEMDLRIQPENMVGGTFGILGMSATAPTGSSLGTPTAAPTTDPLTAFDGDMYEAGVASGLVTGQSVRISNGRTTAGVVGSQFTPDIFEGTLDVSGSFSAFMQDATVLARFYNEGTSSLYTRMDDPAGNFLHLVLPRIKYTGANVDPPREGGVVQELPFQAIVDTTTGVSISFQRSNP